MTRTLRRMTGREVCLVLDQKRTKETKNASRTPPDSAVIQHSRPRRTRPHIAHGSPVAPVRALCDLRGEMYGKSLNHQGHQDHKEIMTKYVKSLVIQLTRPRRTRSHIARGSRLTLLVIFVIFAVSCIGVRSCCVVSQGGAWPFLGLASGLLFKIGKFFLVCS